MVQSSGGSPWAFRQLVTVPRSKQGSRSPPILVGGSEELVASAFNAGSRLVVVSDLYEPGVPYRLAPTIAKMHSEGKLLIFLIIMSEC